MLEEYFPGVSGNASPTFANPVELQSRAAQSIPAAVPAVTEGQTDLSKRVLKSRSSDLARVKQYVLAGVSEKTGHPVTMLDLGLDLEADLGIDMAKQAELLATIRDHSVFHAVRI